MKTLILALTALVSMSAIAAENKCVTQVKKAAVQLEALSQSAPARVYTVEAELVSKVRYGGEFIRTYEVTTVDTRNDGFSRYEISIHDSSCSIIRKIELVAQD